MSMRRDCLGAMIRAAVPEARGAALVPGGLLLLSAP
jgi:hypothetical protein